MEYSFINKCYIDPDSIEREDFCNICQYVGENKSVTELSQHILSFMTPEHVGNPYDPQIAVSYKPQTHHCNVYDAELYMVSLDGEHWLRLQDNYYVTLRLVLPWNSDMYPKNVLAVLTVSDKQEKFFLTKEDFDVIFQENEDKNEETPDSDDGNSSIGEELDS